MGATVESHFDFAFGGRHISGHVDEVAEDLPCFASAVPKMLVNGRSENALFFDGIFFRVLIEIHLLRVLIFFFVVRVLGG